MSWITSYAVAPATSSPAASSAAGAPPVVAPTKTRGSGQSATPGVSSAATADPTASLHDPDSDSSSSKTPIIIGASVGALVLALAAVGTIAIRRKRQRDYHFSSARNDDDAPMLERKSQSAFGLAKRVLTHATTPAMGSQTPRRFDMLEDEESIWSRQTSQRSRRIASSSSGRSVGSFVGGLMMGNKRRRVSGQGGPPEADPRGVATHRTEPLAMHSGLRTWG